MTLRASRPARGRLDVVAGPRPRRGHLTNGGSSPVCRPRRGRSRRNRYAFRPTALPLPSAGSRKPCPRAGAIIDTSPASSPGAGAAGRPRPSRGSQAAPLAPEVHQAAGTGPPRGPLISGESSPVCRPRRGRSQRNRYAFRPTATALARSVAGTTPPRRRRLPAAQCTARRAPQPGHGAGGSQATRRRNHAPAWALLRDVMSRSMTTSRRSRKPCLRAGFATAACRTPAER